MKKLFFREFALLLFAGCLSASGAKAQLDSGGMTFAVSSSFVAGEATLPAGSYKIEQDPDDPGVLQITNMAGSHSVMVMAELVETDAPRKKTEVIFSKYGNTLVLKQLWLAGNDSDILSLQVMQKKRREDAKPGETVCSCGDETGLLRKFKALRSPDLLPGTSPSLLIYRPL